MSKIDWQEICPFNWFSFSANGKLNEGQLSKLPGLILLLAANIINVFFGSFQTILVGCFLGGLPFIIADISSRLR